MFVNSRDQQNKCYLYTSALQFTMTAPKLKVRVPQRGPRITLRGLFQDETGEQKKHVSAAQINICLLFHTVLKECMILHFETF